MTVFLSLLNPMSETSSPTLILPFSIRPVATVPRPVYPTIDTSVTGLSDEFMEAVRAYAKHRGVPMRAIYDEAITAMVDRIDSGENVFFGATVAGREWKPRHIRLTPDVAAAMTSACSVLRVHQSIFLHRAVRDYLSSKGIDAPE